MGREVTVRVWRGDASAGGFQDYRVEIDEGMVVLDVMFEIQAKHAGDLAVRWNCKAGKCGSCSAEINGHLALMCMMRMDDLPRNAPVTVAPMKTFPIVKDLVTDVSFNYEVAKTIPPLRLKPKDPDGKRRMYQHEIDRIQEFHKCIECFLCQDVCHVIRDHPENKPAFAGPRFFIRIAGLEMHPHDTNDRATFTKAKAGIGFCNITKCCSEVCPENIHITDNGIIPMKERVISEHYDPIAKLWRTITRRNRSATADEPQA